MHMIKDEYSRIFMDPMEHFKNKNVLLLEFRIFFKTYRKGFGKGFRYHQAVQLIDR